ncbi:hypothetical protein B0A48_06472 [Cryoendolithus antarcticus]|uniref:Heterokaryon incompatibility domain-containing protein n=1 Tax=Cryoendolithus antarcticus TaxID=1507870 RepID=A0A1V8TBP1_9PEZI|nr:hypothetical protein B0A48_06472 [Cryoendolithus antarcticus]
MRHAHVSRTSAAASCGDALDSEQNPLCALCQMNGVWEHLTAQRILTARDWILGFIASPEDVDKAERQACPFCSMVFRLLPTNAFAPEHIAQYRLRIKYCDVQPRAVRIGQKAVFTSYRVVYNYCEYVSHTAKVYQAHRGQLALDSVDRRKWNVEGDFIHVVRQLEVRYAWVDCLCIIQDDEESKQAQINAMGLIYSAALLTIVQLSGKDANDGLAGARPDPRLVLTELPRWIHISRDESSYSSRGWTLQEELLSRRCLYLSNWGAFWQCRATRFSDIHNGDMVMDVSASDLASFIPQLPDPSIVGAKQTDAEQILRWAVRAEWYSGRKLTYEDDRGKAFQGVLSDLGQSQSRNFLWGHPDGNTLPLSLLWVSVDTPRKASAGILEAPSAPDGVAHVKYWDYVPDPHDAFPSWSWLRLRSQVSFELMIRVHATSGSWELEPECHITTQAALDEEAERERGIDQHMNPALFLRRCRRGFLNLTAPTIASHDLRWINRAGPQTFDLDGSSGSMALVSELYEDVHAADKIRIGVTIQNGADPDSKPCGLLYDDFNRLAPKLWQDGQAVLTMAVYIAGDVAERMGLVFFTKAFWDSRNPSIQAWQLI